MSTLIALPSPNGPGSAGSAAARPRPAYRVTGGRVLRSEWAKLWSLRSTWITLGLSLVLLIAFGVLSASTHVSGTGHGHGADAKDAVAVALGGIDFAQLAIGVLGVLVMAGEYSTGMIRSTLAAVPTRLPVLWSKITGFGAVAFAAGTVGVFVAYPATQAVLHGSDFALGIGSSGVVRSLFGAGIYLALVGVLGVALGALIRSVAGGIGALVAALLLLPLLDNLLPASLKDDINPYLPSNAGSSMFSLHQASHSLSPGAGLAVLAGWVAVATAAAAWRLKRTDA
jgi:ABC-type transport system involved in multi-copper enzyme maturation permease subunit